MSDDVEREVSSSNVPIRLRTGLDLNELTSDKGTELCLEDSQDLNASPTSPTAYGTERIYQQLSYHCTNDSESQTPFELMALEMEDITQAKDRGVLKKVIKQGTGQIVPDKAIVRVHYNGYYEYSDEPYDSSRLRNRQEQFTVGKGECIVGWDIAVSTMRKGELSRFLISPNYAYGELGCPPRIPPNSTIMYEVELMSFVDHDAADAYAGFTKEERELASVSQLIEVARAERELGNDFFYQNMYGRAMRKYEKAVSLIENAHLQNEEDETMWRESLIKLYLNLAICCLKQAKSPRAITYSRKVLELQPNNAKAFFRLGQAYMQLAEFGKSKDYLLKAGRLAPRNEDIRQELLKLDRKVQKYKAIEKVTYTRMFDTRQATKTSPKSNGSEQKEKDIREIFAERFKSFLDNDMEMEFALPSTIDDESIECSIQLAEEMSILYKKGGRYNNFSVRFFKPEIDHEQ